MSKQYESGVIVQKEVLSDGIIDMWIAVPAIASICIPGQFVSFYCKDSARLLPRPISICDVDEEKRKIRFIFRIAGEGTKEFSKMRVFDEIRLLGPLGNGYSELSGTKVVLFGGGIGIPPMYYLARLLASKNRLAGVCLGYRNSDTFLLSEFEALTNVVIATDDGSLGTKGTVLDAIRENPMAFDMLAACGPMPMLRGIKHFAEENKVQAYLSLEERMACGIGACLGCVCKSKQVDEHSHVNNKRICLEGPVFEAKEIDI